jgi:hypothetical protein
MTIKLDYRRSYGHTRYYPACEVSKLLASLAGSPCFSSNRMETLRELARKLGFKIETQIATEGKDEI